MFSPIAAAVLLACATSPARAEIAIGGGFSITGNAALVSDYRFRGVSRSDEDFAAQGGVEIAHERGFYAGVWGSSLSDSAFGNAELNGYGGWSGEIASGFTLDAGARYYAFTGEGPLGDDYVEPRASLSYSIGPAEITTGAAWAPDALGSEDNVYVFSDLSVGIYGTPITAIAHLGYTDGPFALQGDGDALDWSVGGEAAFGPVSVGLSYVDTDGAGDLANATVVGSVGVRF